MKNVLFNRFAVLVLAAGIGIFCTPTYAYADDYPYQLESAVQSDDITAEQANQIMSGLRETAKWTKSGNYQMKDTGIVCSRPEAEAIIAGFKQLWLATDAPVLYYNTSGFDMISVNPGQCTKTDIQLKMAGSGDSTQNHIFVGWNPAFDIEESLCQQEESSRIVDSIISQAPAEDSEKVKYFNDYLYAKFTYDSSPLSDGYYKYAGYYGLTGQGCVCNGYAETFFTLCYRAGIETSYITCWKYKDSSGEKGYHAMNAVRFSDGEWLEVDPIFRVYLDPLGSDFQTEMDKPYSNRLS